MLENGIAQLCNRKHAFAVCNGTAALELAVKALGIGTGDEVIMPTFTIISCALAVVRAGATPIYVDAEPTTWNMRVEDIEALITEKTRAIMAVHIYGLTVDMDPLLEIARKYNLKVIEDAAEVIGQTYKDIPCGSFGDISTFSFYPNKHITTGEGGMLLTNSDELAIRCMSLRNLSFGKKDRFIHEHLGWNFRMSNLQAAVGVAQMERLPKTVLRKKEIGAIYSENLRFCKSLQLPLACNNHCENIYWVFGITSKKNGRTAKWWIDALKNEGIGTRPFFYPMHSQPALAQFCEPGIKHPNSKHLSEYGFYLPSGTTLTNDEIHQICRTIIRLEKK